MLLSAMDANVVAGGRTVKPLTWTVGRAHAGRSD